jgi:hypothetical protein
MLWYICINLKQNFLINGDKHRLLHWKQLKTQLVLLLTTHNLSHKVNFAAGIQNYSITAIDNIFVNYSWLNLSSVSPIINGLSGYDAQILTIKNLSMRLTKVSLKQRTRFINNKTTTNFKKKKHGNLFIKIKIPTLCLTHFCALS